MSMMTPDQLPALFHPENMRHASLPVRQDGSCAPVLASPRRDGEVAVRVATLDDYAFVDMLQKMHSHMVGFLRRGAIQTYLSRGHVLLAESADDARQPLGYIIHRDEYKHRDHLGIIYQLNVSPVEQRRLIGARLLHEAFSRSAYGCKLYCCWCAQDIRANYFWESVGFVPIAFRTGSRGKQRIHIFWQRRVHAEDTTTPYWYPHRTDSGAVSEERIVLPIPPGVHWRDPMPLVVPLLEVHEADALAAGKKPEEDVAKKTLAGGALVRPREAHAARERVESKHLGGTPRGYVGVVVGGRIKHVPHPDTFALEEAIRAEEAKERKRVSTPKKERAKYLPEHVAAARDVRDRYMEDFNEVARMLPPGACGKWDVSRGMLEAGAGRAHVVDRVLALPPAA
ncbi:MAG: hypothetical protein ACR2GY_13285 [Phycisphaerales bacterium]